MDRTNRKQAEFILGEITIPCVTMVNEVIGLTIQGTQLLINTYFGGFVRCGNTSKVLLRNVWQTRLFPNRNKSPL